MDTTKCMDDLRCEVCWDAFNDNIKRPRVLTCGHSFCHSCLQALLKPSMFCPYCKQVITYTSAESIPVNFSIDRLISRLNIDDRARERKLMHEGHCVEHDNYNEFRCMDCELWICGSCAMLQHKLCRTLVVPEAYSELKTTLVRRVQKGLRKLKATTDKITESINDLNGNRNESLQGLDLKILEKKIKELKWKQLALNQECEDLKSLQAEVELSKNFVDFSKAKEFIDSLLEKGKKNLMDSNRLASLSIEGLGSLCRDEVVYAVAKHGDVRLYGRVAAKDGRVWISSFLPAKRRGVLIALKDLLLRFCGSTKLPKTCFLQFTQDGVQGDVFETFIEAKGSSPNSKKFFLFCSALQGLTFKGNAPIGPSYIGTFAPDNVEGMTDNDAGKADENVDYYLQLHPVRDYVVSSTLTSPSPVRKLSTDVYPLLTLTVRNMSLQQLKDNFKKKCLVTDCGLVIP